MEESLSLEEKAVKERLEAEAAEKLERELIRFGEKKHEEAEAAEKLRQEAFMNIGRAHAYEWYIYEGRYGITTKSNYAGKKLERLREAAKYPNEARLRVEEAERAYREAEAFAWSKRYEA